MCPPFRESWGDDLLSRIYGPQLPLEICYATLPIAVRYRKNEMKIIFVAPLQIVQDLDISFLVFFLLCTQAVHNVKRLNIKKKQNLGYPNLFVRVLLILFSSHSFCLSLHWYRETKKMFAYGVNLSAPIEFCPHTCCRGFWKLPPPFLCCGPIFISMYNLYNLYIEIKKKVGSHPRSTKTKKKTKTKT